MPAIKSIYCIIELCNGRRAYYVCHCIIKYDIVRRDTNRKSFYSYLFSLHIQGNILIELFMAIGLMMYHSEYFDLTFVYISLEGNHDLQVLYYIMNYIDNINGSILCWQKHSLSVLRILLPFKCLKDFEFIHWSSDQQKNV